MSSSSSKLVDTNKLLKENYNVVRSFTDIKTLLVLHLIYRRGGKNIQQISKELEKPIKEVEDVINSLLDVDLIYPKADTFFLTSLAKKRLDLTSFSLDFLEGKIIGADVGITNPLPNKYRIENCIGRGATSFTFKASQVTTGLPRTIKIFLPGVINFEVLQASVQKLVPVQGKKYLPDIQEIGQIRIVYNTEETILLCVVLECIDDSAKTFEGFLRSKDNITPLIFNKFIESVGGALSTLEQSGLIHGDLHEGNILVIEGDHTGAKEFCVIDHINVQRSPSPNIQINSDMDNFFNHFLKAFLIASKHSPNLSAKTIVGSRALRVFEGLQKGKYSTFKELLTDFYEKKSVPQNYFKKPSLEAFGWKRVEWFSSVSDLYKLFEPVKTKFTEISRFGNTWISGPRGCGKSHYLRVLEFNPEVIAETEKNHVLEDKLNDLNYDFREYFGVLFACRLGEFTIFTPEAENSVEFNSKTQRILKHILLLKIWNRTLETINRGLKETGKGDMPILEAPPNFINFIEFIENKFGSITLIDDIPKIEQIIDVCVAKENVAIANWTEPSKFAENNLLNEKDLDEFFNVTKKTFPDLGKSHFYILVDDMTHPYVHYELQKIFNSLVRVTQSNHCFKITFEKFFYTSGTYEQRVIDPVHEINYVNLGEVLPTAQKQNLVDYSAYLSRVINSRLRAEGYPQDIKELLGKSQSSKDFLSALSLPGARRPKKREKSKRDPRPRAYYAGWNIIVSLSHGSVRTLIDIVESIIENAKIRQNTKSITLRKQDSVVKAYSKKMYNSISMYPGELEGKSWGEVLSNVLSAIGKVSREYLEKYDTGEEGRWYETISIERRDQKPLSTKASSILTELIKYNLIFDEGHTFSRAQFGLCKRYDMNKIYAPSFKTTYRVRNHLYLNCEGLETLLLEPTEFVKKHRSRIKKKSIDPRQKRLFKDGK